MDLKTVPSHALYEQLKTDPDYRILKRVRPRDTFGQLPANAQIVKILVLDTETTGLDLQKDEAVELGAVLIEVDASTGQVGRVLGQFSGLEEPQAPMSKEAQDVHGISPEQLKGLKFDDEAFNALCSQADFVCAHNARFDRAMTVKRFKVALDKPWLCSFSEIDWHGEGYMAAKLAILLNESEFFHEAHRAVEDVIALIHVLNTPLKKSKMMPFAQLLKSAKSPQIYLGALRAPFAAKDVLKANGFRWHAEQKIWEIEVNGQDRAQELILMMKKSVYMAPKIGILQATLEGRFRYGPVVPALVTV